MLFKERLDCFHVQPVVLIRVPFQGRGVQVSVSEIGLDRVLLVLHVVVVHSRELASLPGEVAHVEGVVQGPEEQHPVCDHRKLVDVPQLHWVLCFHHFN